MLHLWHMSFQSNFGLIKGLPENFFPSGLEIHSEPGKLAIQPLIVASVNGGHHKVTLCERWPRNRLEMRTAT